MIPKGVRRGLVDVACRNTLIHTPRFSEVPAAGERSKKMSTVSSKAKPFKTAVEGFLLTFVRLAEARRE